MHLQFEKSFLNFFVFRKSVFQEYTLRELPYLPLPYRADKFGFVRLGFNKNVNYFLFQKCTYRPMHFISFIICVLLIHAYYHHFVLWWVGVSNLGLSLFMILICLAQIYKKCTCLFLTKTQTIPFLYFKTCILSLVYQNNLTGFGAQIIRFVIISS